MHIITGNDSGGGGKYLLDLCSNKLEDFDSIIGFLGKGYLFDKSNKNGISNILFESKTKYKLDILSCICNYVQHNSIDIINFHGPKANFIHFLIKGKISAKTVTTVHSNYKFDFMNNKYKKLFYTPLSIMGLKSFKNFICVSDSIKNLLDDNKLRGTKKVINSSIDLNSYSDNADKDKIRKSYNISSEEFVYVNVARMHPIKNHIGLLRAFSILKKEALNIKLILVGDGEEVDNLKLLVKELSLEDDVVFTGFQNNPVDFIRASDISILTSFDEGGAPPIVILESALARKPAICSNVGNINKTINDENGFLVDPNSITDIYEKMKLAYIRRELLPKMGEELYCFVKSNHSIEKLWREHYEFYNRIYNEGC